LWGMPRPLPRVPHVESPFVQRAELLTLVPQSMSTIDRLEAEGQFPKRIRLEPTSRVAWVRREIMTYLRHLARRKQSVAQEDHIEAANEELVARLESKRADPRGSAR
jgi:predicted DNA-binding transcriptional regulator AlpA